MKHLFYPIALLLFLLFPGKAAAQFTHHSYFDGTDTLYPPITIYKTPLENNCWQIGQPQKALFNRAATVPNAIMTDTLTTYPVSDSSSFYFYLPKQSMFNGILAIKWVQKLDLDSGRDFALIEFSVDSGNNWQSAFDNPYGYNFYGFHYFNIDTFIDGTIGLTGTDTVWRNIWLCFNNSWIQQFEDVRVRFTLRSDSIDNGKEGWIMDNFRIEPTYFHTVQEMWLPQYLNVFPNPTQNRVYIELAHQPGFHIIEEITLIDPMGKVLQSWENCPPKFFIDVSPFTSGHYYLKVRSNLREETVPIVIQH